MHVKRLNKVANPVTAVLAAEYVKMLTRPDLLRMDQIGCCVAWPETIKALLEDRDISGLAVGTPDAFLANDWKREVVIHAEHHSFKDGQSIDKIIPRIAVRQLAVPLCRSRRQFVLIGSTRYYQSLPHWRELRELFEIIQERGRIIGPDDLPFIL